MINQRSVVSDSFVVEENRSYSYICDQRSHYTIITVVWENNATLTVLVTSLWSCDILLISNIVDEGVMNHLMPNKQCLFLFLPIILYICLPYPHKIQLLFLAEVYTFKLENNSCYATCTALLSRVFTMYR